MTVSSKSDGTYSVVVGVSSKNTGTYTAVAGVFAKVSGLYKNILNTLLPVDGVAYFFGTRNVTPVGMFSTSTQQYQVSRPYWGKVTYPAYDFQIELPNFYTATSAANDSLTQNAINIQGWSIGYSETNNPTTATWVRGKIAGVDTARIDPSVVTTLAGILTDPLITQGTVMQDASDAKPYYIWFAVAYSTDLASQTIPAVLLLGPNTGDGMFYSALNNITANLTNGVASTVTNNTTAYGPAFAVCKGQNLAVTPKPVVLEIGDSIGYGQNENAYTMTEGTRGYIPLGLKAAGWSCNNIAVFGTSPDQWVTNGRNAASGRLNAVALVAASQGGCQPFTIIVSEHGINSASTSGWTTASGFLTGMTSYYGVIRTEYPDMKIAQTQILARPSSTSDLCVTLSNQAASTRFIGSGSIKTFNDGLVTNLNGDIVDYFIPTQAAWEDVANLGKIRVSAWSTTVAATYIANAVTIIIVGAAPEGAMLVVGGQARGVRSQVDVGGGNFTITLLSGFTSGASIGATVNETYSQDALHPEHYAHKYFLAPVVNTWANATSQ